MAEDNQTNQGSGAGAGTTGTGAGTAGTTGTVATTAVSAGGTVAVDGATFVAPVIPTAPIPPVVANTAPVSASTTTAGSTTTSDGSKSAAVSNGGVVIDKNKSNEQYIIDAEKNYIIPDIVRSNFADLVKLIYETESMNEEEREYWLQILAIMSEEQIVKFRDILVNEKQQLERLDQEYDTQMAKINDSKPKEINANKIKEELQQIKAAEKADDIEDDADEAALLKQLEGL